MEKQTLKITTNSLAKALFFGHLSNITLAAGTLALLHWGLGASLLTAICCALIVAAILSVLLAMLGTQRARKPIDEIHAQFSTLHEKMQSSEALAAKASENAAALLENLPVGFLTFTGDMELQAGNEAAFSLLGTSKETAETQSVLEHIKQLKSSGAIIQFTDWLHEVRSNKIQESRTWPFITFIHGEQTKICDMIAHYNKGDSHGNELILLFIDRTDEYSHQERQMEFIALAAHELRGPITVMRGLVDILSSELGPTFSSEHKELMTRIIVSSRQLSGYVDNILNVSKIDKDSFEIKPKEADWQHIIQQVIRDLDVRARAHHRTIELKLSQKPLKAAVDPAIIVHVINNLVDNAIKYSKDGGIIIVSTDLKDGQIETTVQDFGIGIPANVVGNLFTRFYRSHRSKQAVNGTGLGLYLCKTIVEAHGGSIWVRSSEGSGTTFGFTLPTYDSIADKVKAGHNEEGIERGTHGWIKNHALYRR